MPGVFDPITLNIKGLNPVEYHPEDDILNEEILHADIGDKKAELFYLIQSDHNSFKEEDITSDDYEAGRLLYNIYEEDFRDIYDYLNPLMESVGDYLPESDRKIWNTIIESGSFSGKEAVEIIKNRKTILPMMALAGRFSIQVNGEEIVEFYENEDDKNEKVEEFLGNLVENIPATEDGFDINDKRIDLSSEKVELFFDSLDVSESFTETLICSLKLNGAPVFMVMYEEHGNKYYSITNERSSAGKWDSGYAGFMLAEDNDVGDCRQNKKTVAEVEEICQKTLTRYNNVWNGEIYNIVSEKVTFKGDHPEVAVITDETEHSQSVIGHWEAREHLVAECLDKIVAYGGDPAESQYEDVSKLAKEIANRPEFTESPLKM